jgi:hypothetical protein
MRRSSIAVTLLLAFQAHAQPLPPPPELERPPAPAPGEAANSESPRPPPAGPETAPPPARGGIEPEVTITRRGQVIIQEYRVNGRLYMIRVIPPIGFPYYLLDTNGNGVWDTRLNDLAPISPPQWILFSW